MPVVIKQSFIRIEEELLWKRFLIVVFLTCSFPLESVTRHAKEYCTYIISHPISDIILPKDEMNIPVSCGV